MFRLRAASHHNGFSPLSSTHLKIKKAPKKVRCFVILKMVVEDGFEPSKSVTADLQSAPFGRSGIPPHIGAGRGSRTPMTSLEGWCTAVMPYPHNFIFLSTATVAFCSVLVFQNHLLPIARLVPTVGLEPTSHC